MGYIQPQFNVRKVAGGYSIFPEGVTTDDLYIYANPIDAYPLIRLEGNAGIRIQPTAGNPVTIYNAATTALQLQYETGNNQFSITSMIDAKDLYLATTGTGVLKFGTHTGSGDVACNGSILVKDAAGNSRKLMTTA
jgi:hypothetical protein